MENRCANGKAVAPSTGGSVRYRTDIAVLETVRGFNGFSSMTHATRTETDRSVMDLSTEWDRPVTVFIDGTMELIYSPFDALFWLNNHWPRGLPPPEEAQLACYDALA